MVSRCKISAESQLRSRIFLSKMASLGLGVGLSWGRSTALATFEIGEVQAQQIGGMMNVSTMRTGPRRYG